MRRSKYGAVRTEVDGISFASKREANRYMQLTILQRAKQISDLKLQVKCPISINGIYVFSLVMDFVYWDRKNPDVPILVYEDCKGYRTDVYKLKRKCFEAQYKSKILET